MRRRPPTPTLFPYTTLFRSGQHADAGFQIEVEGVDDHAVGAGSADMIDRKSTRLNSSHRCISYAVFCLKKKIGVPTGRITSVLIPPLMIHGVPPGSRLVI